MDTKIQVSRKTDSVDQVGKARGDVYVLENLIVHEVSSVDVPANKRRWLMIKNAQGNQGNSLMPDGKGGFVTKSSAPAQTDTTIEAPATAAVTQDAPAPETDAAILAEKTEPVAEEVTVTTEPTIATEPAAEVEVEAAKTEPDALSVVAAAPDALATQAATPTEVVVAAAAPPEATVEVAAPAAPAPVEPAAAAAAVTAAAPVAASEVEIDEATAAVLEGAAGVMKAGRKLSAERKARLQQIADQLSELLADLEERKGDMYDAEKAMKEMRDEMLQLQTQLSALGETNKQLTSQVEELRATNKGTGTITTVQAEKAAPPVSGQFEVKASAPRPANVGWIGLQRELNQRKKK